ncbi:MAG: Flp pilus assembly protein CpaB [Firmicutes bacterium HGW-Firmicutes-12]|nr:MAG: Flp pilus assembly protein CpaB [Firmicutes bacterium HGW-Firmicutes-12]
MKSKYIMILSLIFGLLTAYLIYNFLVETKQSMNDTQYGEVVVAAVDVLGKTQVTNEMLQVMKVPVEYIHPLAIREKNNAVGKITNTAISQGEEILQNKLIDIGEVNYGLSYAVPLGKRAVTIAVDDVSGISGLIKPGDKVDVAAVVNLPEEGGQKEVPNALVVLQDVQVLAVGITMEDRSGGKGTLDYKNITVAVTVEDARPLILASQKGVIRLMLRSPIDTSTVVTEPFSPEEFLP